MIVKMSKIHIVARQIDKERLLDRLAQLNVLHLEPVHPDQALADDETLKEITDLGLGIETLAPIEQANSGPDLKPIDAAREAIKTRAAISENQHRLDDLHQTAEAMSIWGDVTLRQFMQLRESGVDIRFFSVPKKHANLIQAECMEVITELPEKRMLVAVIDRSGRITLPEEAHPVLLPSQDRPTIRATAAKIDADLKQDFLRLSQLACLIDALRDERKRLAAEIEYITAQRSGLSTGELFAVQGWVPSEDAANLGSRLSDYDVHAAVSAQPVGQEEVPPTLIHYPSWTKPIKGLFDMLGTLPGYREMDLSPFFMVALPIFAAMLIGDAGYGLLIAVTGLIFYKKLARVAGTAKAQLVIIFGLVTLVWGMLTANYFGVTPETLAISGGFVRSAEAGAQVDYEALWSGIGFYSRAARLMRWAATLWRQDPMQARFLIIKISLIIGCLHLILGHFRKAMELIPDQRALAEVGWIVALADMLVVIWHLLFIGAGQMPATVWWILILAMVLPVWFGKPAKNAGKRILLGFASSMLPLLSTFSDTMSYIRLFAVGLASYYIAAAFNVLGARLAETATWFTAAPIIVFGHALNIGLAGIAIFAHGVRLNMLEFSNNAGVQWAGYAYRPFTKGHVSISGEKMS